MIESRSQAAEEYLLDLVQTSLDEWGKGEWCGAVKSKWQKSNKKDDRDVNMK